MIGGSDSQKYILVTPSEQQQCRSGCNVLSTYKLIHSPPLRKTFSYPWIIITHEIEWSNSPALQLLLLHFELLLKVVHVAFFPLCVHTDYYSLGIPFFLGTRNFLPFDYKRHFPDFFPLLQFLFHRVLKHGKNVCYFTIKFRLLLSGCRILFLSLILQKKFMEHLVLIQYFDTDSKG